MKSNPGKNTNIYDLPAIVDQALPNALTPVNIHVGFRACGIYPFNPDIVADDEFMPSNVTDRPQPQSSSAPTTTATHEQEPGK